MAEVITTTKKPTTSFFWPGGALDIDKMDTRANWRQQRALYKRYATSICQSPLKSLLRLLIWPGLNIGLLIWAFQFSRMATEDPTKKEFTALLFIKKGPRFAVMLTIFHFYSLGQQMIKDKASGFKSLMLTSGLKRHNYNLVMATSSLLYLLPLSIIMTIVTKKYMFDQSISYWSLGANLLLFAFHADSFLTLLASLITSSSYAFVILIVVYFENMTNNLAHILVTSLGQVTKPYIVFAVTLSPFQAVRSYCDNYLDSRGFNSDLGADSDPIITQKECYIIMAQLFWTITLRLFALWFEEVCPWQKGTAPKSSCFSLEAPGERYSEEFLEAEEEREHGENSYFEQRDIVNRDAGIQISRLSKWFKTVPAVKEVTLTIYKGETTLLLGHNGAGKSTLMNMILGLLKPDGGMVRIKARSKDAPASTIGICPQSSVLDDDLSVLQHLELFTDLKSDIEGSERKLHIEQTLTDVDLVQQANKRPQELSGGMKRKLSLALALVGKSEVLILDEPSSGLDPDSRMFIWDTIRRCRAQRTVLLSTQHMEEADYLGDRIAILNAGRLVCCGSSVFLNNLFGSGYRLRIECSVSSRLEVLDRVRNYFKEAQPEEEDNQASETLEPGSRCDFVVELRREKDTDAEAQMIGLLTDLENHKDELKINSYGLKSSSIEDVMLNTGEMFATKLANEQGHVHLTIQSVGEHLETLAQSKISSNSAGEPEFLRNCRIITALCKKQGLIYAANFFTVFVIKILMPTLGAFNAVDKANSPIRIETYWQSAVHTLMVAQFVYFPVRERVSKFKIMQLNTDMKIWHYWASWFLIDLLAVLPCVVSINVCLVEHLEAKVMVPWWKLHFIVTVATIMFCLAAMSFCYAASNVLSSPKVAYGTIVILCTTSTLAYVLVFLLRLAFFDSEEQRIQDLASYTGVIFLPNDAYAQVFVGLSNQCYLNAIAVECQPTQGVSNMAIGFSALLFQALAYAALLFAIESQVVNIEWYLRWGNFYALWKRKRPIRPTTHEIDEDVLTETAKAKAAINRVNDVSNSLVVAGLRKSYVRGEEVIRGLSFVVQKGECFGLLGVNGAGKTTTFSMLAGESLPDSGRIIADGIECSENLGAYRQVFGYDPQPEIDLSLTPHQALRLMARLRGVREHLLPGVIHATLELLSMSQHEHKPNKKLSGGTKRKLALGMALVGNPIILALDEPTAGVDPLARRNIWQLLKSLRSQNKASIVISSHAMEECEAICDRISIMSRGRLRCIGSFLHLRSKFAKGCSLKVHFEEVPADVPDVTRNLGSRLDKRLLAAQVEELTGQLKLELEKSICPSVVKMADRSFNSVTFEITDNRKIRPLVFKVMRDFKRRHQSAKITYMLNDSSLEDIFVSMAQEQQELEQQELESDGQECLMLNN